MPGRFSRADSEAGIVSASSAEISATGAAESEGAAAELWPEAEAGAEAGEDGAACTSIAFLGGG